MSTLNIIAVISIFTSPLVAIFVSIWYQNRKEKRKAKLDLFFTIISLRGLSPIPSQLVATLNKIVVVFHKDEKVISAWKSYFESLNPKSPDFQSNGKRLLDLLDEMAKSLGYNNLKQTTLDQYYYPQGLFDVYATNSELIAELLRVLKNSEKFGLNIQPPEKNRHIEK